MNQDCATCSKLIGTSQVHILCSKCLKSHHANCVNLTTKEIGYFAENGDNKWVCSACCRRGRVTRSNSSSSSTSARPAVSPHRSDEATASDPLALILCQLSTMANDIRDIKNSQAQLSNDVSHCMSLLQQHSASIVRHDELISNCEASIQQLQSAQASILSNISNVESRLTNALRKDGLSPYN
ncbi:unnamed protein product [Acanthoscelides obtectus]|uniref:PHD-type domain-containing protein n=1 Tax=Acanthoscelides obtectus TaxID=200917 RepID=A0A9P0JQ61_ACAOB|nr:unnamed protein product [Acanthoscelides obtectus]CAK1661761.1 hypothetical protein AOBTE_LOCUS22782 [Acanthoscelides obtectus]